MFFSLVEEASEHLLPSRAQDRQVFHKYHMLVVVDMRLGGKGRRCMESDCRDLRSPKEIYLLSVDTDYKSQMLDFGGEEGLRVSMMLEHFLL